MDLKKRVVSLTIIKDLLPLYLTIILTHFDTKFSSANKPLFHHYISYLSLSLFIEGILDICNECEYQDSRHLNKVWQTLEFGISVLPSAP